MKGSTCGVAEHDREAEVVQDLRLLCEKSQAMAVGRSWPLSENKRQPARPEEQDGGTEMELNRVTHFRNEIKRGGVGGVIGR